MSNILNTSGSSVPSSGVCWCEIEIKADALHSIEVIVTSLMDEMKKKLDPSGRFSRVQCHGNLNARLEIEIFQDDAGKILEIVRAASAGSALKYSVKFSF